MKPQWKDLKVGDIVDYVWNEHIYTGIITECFEDDTVNIRDLASTNKDAFDESADAFYCIHVIRPIPLEILKITPTGVNLSLKDKYPEHFI